MMQKEPESVAIQVRIYSVKGARVQAEEYRRSSADKRWQGLAQGSNE